MGPGRKATSSHRRKLVRHARQKRSEVFARDLGAFQLGVKRTQRLELDSDLLAESRCLIAQLLAEVAKIGSNLVSESIHLGGLLASGLTEQEVAHAVERFCVRGSVARRSRGVEYLYGGALGA